jgi:hypothetical protein
MLEGGGLCVQQLAHFVFSLTLFFFRPNQALPEARRLAPSIYRLLVNAAATGAHSLRTEGILPCGTASRAASI